MKDWAKLLIADCNKNVRELLRREFVRDGYRAELARNGREIIKAVSGDGAPDLVVMELLLPFMDGLFVLEKIRDLDENLPVIVFTDLVDYRDDPIVKRCASLFIEKEGSLESLKRAVRDFLWIGPIPGIGGRENGRSKKDKGSDRR